MIPDDELANVLRQVLLIGGGFSINYCGMLEIGELASHTETSYWVESRDFDGNILWEKDSLSLEEAMAHFLRIRQERGIGLDIELDGFD